MPLQTNYKQLYMFSIYPENVSAAPEQIHFVGKTERYSYRKIIPTSPSQKGA